MGIKCCKQKFKTKDKKTKKSKNIHKNKKKIKNEIPYYFDLVPQRLLNF